MPQVFFDNYSVSYDEHFTDSAVGLAQRRVVHAYLEKILSPKKTILEINCGTGVDAFFLSQKCKSVTCTDISGKMVETTKLKTEAFGNCFTIESSIQNLCSCITTKSDMVFSNFGGLNCLNKEEFETFAQECASLTNNESEMVFVIMGKKCLWERLYFIFKGDFKKASRRTEKDGVKVGMSGEEFTVYYYSPGEVGKIFGEYFEVKHKEAVGLFVPPSYLNTYFEKHSFLFSGLNKLDKIFRKFSFLSDYADHYLIHLKRR